MANEGVICRFRKCQEIENKEWEQYIEAFHTLNKELMAKIVALVRETYQREEAEKAKTNQVTELATLRDQMVKAKVDAVAEFWISQPFFDMCDVYYRDMFDVIGHKLNNPLW